MANHNQAITDLAQAQFGPSAKAYVTSTTHAHGADLARLLELAAPASHERALDVATGGGHTALLLAPHVHSVIALDLTTPMLLAGRAHIAEQGVANVTYCRALAEALPLADACIDLSVCRLATHHFADPASYAREAARTLRSGGRLLIADHIGLDDPELDTFMDRFERWRDPSHVRAYTFTEWRGMLQAASLEVEHTEWIAYEPYLFEPWTSRLRMPESERTALEQWLLDAEPRFKEFFAVREADGRVQSLTGRFGIITARKQS